MLQKIKNIFYNPRKVAGRESRIQIHEKTILLDSSRFHFRGAGGSVRIGAESMIGCHFIFESDRGEISVGDRSYISGGTQLISREKINIGSDVTISWGVYIYDHNGHSLDWKQRAQDVVQQNTDHRAGLYFGTHKDWSGVKSQPIEIQDKVWIGFDSVILKGVRIGEGAIVSARSVVREDVPAWSIVSGNPAVVVGKVNS